MVYQLLFNALLTENWLYWMRQMLYRIFEFHLEIVWKNCQVTGKGNIVSGSIINGAFVLFGGKVMPLTSKL